MASRPNPLVSVIVPSYNQGRFIGETIKSILSQDYRPIEVLVIDGASTDQTAEVVRSFGSPPELRFWSEPDSGVVEAVNKGLARANGVFAAIQSSDDTYLPGAIGTAVAALLRPSAPGLVYGNVVKVDAQGMEIDRTSLPEFSIEALLSLGTWIPQPGAFFRLALARKLGGWCGSVAYAADTDLWLRIAFCAPITRIESLLATRRVHADQRDTQGARIIRDYKRMIRRSPDLEKQPFAVRRAATAGVLLLQNRYAYDDGYWKKWVRRLAASLVYPRVFSRFPLTAYVPGGEWMMAQAVEARNWVRNRMLAQGP